jgi:hypothetical protein
VDVATKAMSDAVMGNAAFLKQYANKVQMTRWVVSVAVFLVFCSYLSLKWSTCVALG